MQGSSCSHRPGDRTGTCCSVGAEGRAWETYLRAAAAKPGKKLRKGERSLSGSSGLAWLATQTVTAPFLGPSSCFYLGTAQDRLTSGSWILNSPCSSLDPPTTQALPFPYLPHTLPHPLPSSKSKPFPPSSFFLLFFLPTSGLGLFSRHRGFRVDSPRRYLH